MPQHYTVPTKNPFAVLDDDSDADDKILSKPADPAPLTTNQFEQSTTATNNRQNRRDDQRPPRNNRNNTRPNNSQQQTNDDDAAAADDHFPPKPLRHHQTGPQGGHAGPSSSRTGKTQQLPAQQPGGPQTNRTGLAMASRPLRENQREFDRHSGTGRGRELKKSGGGAHNWGNEFADFGAPNGDNETGETKPAGEEGVNTGEEEPVKEEETGQPKQLSYAAYKASREEQRAALSTGGDEDNTASLDEDKQKYLQDGYQIYTKESASAPAGRNEEVKSGADDESKNRPKTLHLAEVAAQTGGSLYSFGRGQRGGQGRGGQGRGGMSSQERPVRTKQGSGNAAQAAGASTNASSGKEINLSDNQAFPTLQAH